jgi:hypothetical protein
MCTHWAEGHDGEEYDELGAEEDFLQVGENRADRSFEGRTSNPFDFLPFAFCGSMRRWWPARLSSPGGDYRHNDGFCEIRTLIDNYQF